MTSASPSRPADLPTAGACGTVAAATPTTSTPASATTTVGRLTAEWQHLTISASDLRRVRDWQLPGGEITSLDDILQRCGFVRFVPMSPGERRPRAVRARPVGEGDPCDAYMVRLLVPGPHRSARRADRAPADPARADPRRHGATLPPHIANDDVLDDLVANAWTLIRTYPVERRQHRVVANLVRDIGFATTVRPIRRRSAAEKVVGPDHFGEIEERWSSRDPLTELAEVLAQAHEDGIIDERDVQLLCDLVNLGRADRVAAALKVTARTVRNHRDAILYRLRAAHREALAA